MPRTRPFSPLFQSQSLNLPLLHAPKLRNKKTSRTLVWEDELPWKRELSKKQVELPLVTGGKVILCLGFYFVWYSEYCLVVETSDTVAPAPSWASGTYRRLAETSKSKMRLKLGKKAERKGETATGPSEGSS